MPTAPSPADVRPATQAPDESAPWLAARRSADDRAESVRWRRAVTLMLMTLVLPGSAQLVAGNRRVGRWVLRIWAASVLLVLLVVGLSMLNHGVVFWMASNTYLLGFARILLIALAIAWALLLVDAWRLGEPLSLRRNHRLAAAGLNGLICLGLAAVLLFSAHLVAIQRSLIISLSGDGIVTGAHDGRFNVLLLGGDAGVGRWGLRPDSITLASIDARTGRTVLIGLPRNMANVPFAKGSVMHKQFPHGFRCDDCYLNAISTWAEDHKQLFGKSKHPGVDATISAVEGVTGLEVNYWAMVNLRGFQDLVDAMGGVVLNVRSPIPVGGLGDDVTGYIKPGKRRLNGHDALWFARAREGSDDYSRMARQKCVLNAIVTQISPQTAVRNFSKLAKASSQLIATNLPAGEFDRFMSLALKAKQEPISTLSLVPPLVNTGNPDFALIRDKVASTIDHAEAKSDSSKSATAGKGKAKAKRSSGSLTGGSLGSLSDGYAANQSENLASAC
jgi:LCP family protein required for cell wall assembly